MSPSKNLFATVLTHAAPSSNYRGESEENRTVLQKISRGGAEFTVISPESMRNALREVLAGYGLPMNRRRLHDEDQLAVEFKEFPSAEKFADDFLFGFMVADKKAVEKNKGQPAKRDSVLRMNLAVALHPYRFDAMLNQSPLNAGKSPWKNAGSSALLHREVVYTAYQYPFALSVADCLAIPEGKKWASQLLKAIGELSGVAGGHARSLFEMAPRSLVARLTPSLVAGYDTYGFDPQGGFPELSRLTGERQDLDAREFWVGGELVRNMKAEERRALEEKGAHLYDNPQALLEKLAAAAFVEA
ncbi:type I-B CRISPR-associated protein Cas7/Cst2/DevR [Cystobacter ferrugineus]|uniref:Type I-B CRISPR-associated protein Cas7/Cst2/DevR n=1 Tax=Cystobacter ferrugineus TaxID=83449 RepID=A0A1L9AV93_9BACT|nr:type I-B CRISPR-associated protein Cas7/Cst2/DevR [Cystobacter ferrugineus]OJH33916.1 type I-B CRISPR-associated protein Cas7/Cst2/DevR [Cystobacter ferrugineus]